MTAASLSGRTVVVTRDEACDGPLGAALRDLGARPIHRPVLAIRPSDAGDALRAALEELPRVDWLLLTSARAVEVLNGAGVFEATPPDTLRVAAVGSRTAAAVRGHGWPVHLVPESAGAEGLLAALEARGIGPGQRVLFPASARARPLLESSLVARGVRVDVVPVYAPAALELDADAWRRPGEASDWDALTFTSPSAVEALAEALPPDALGALRSLPAGVQGPTTAEAARDAGWTRVVEAHPRTFRGLAAALARHLGPDPIRP